MTIHPTAVIDTSAQIAEGVVIGPWCIVGPGVILAEGVKLVSHVVMQQDTSVSSITRRSWTKAPGSFKR